MYMRRVVWDNNKAAANRAKHKVSFETASLVFLDRRRIERRDDSIGNVWLEERFQTVGKVGKLYFVVYTEREDEMGETTRIISARIATKAERRSYHGYDDGDFDGWTEAD
jgi:uncharacterized DUF497 family protein